ncbi:MAG: hypothetical protein KatS3mg068_2454 [Candidatus Sericytochromatia bacterium]|nr:MAG: hypothetical protein KatS3mg068_2454 [Candidatus Sericytochromatia bacterium]
MTFNNVNIFRSVVKTLNTSGSNTNNIKRGGAFSPTTFEAVSIMRAEFDNQWDNSYITKYEALLQTRLNRLKQELNNAYKALLEISGGMHIREDADSTSANKSLLTAYGTTIPGGSANAFQDLKYYSDSNSFEAADVYNQTAGDGIPSYWQDDPNLGKYEMRRLYITGPALQISNEIKVAMRTEEVPGKAATISSFLEDVLGSKPFVGAQKVAEYSTEVKTGGFWSTINYLFNFSPREIKYNYVTAYSTTSEEAGTRQVNGKQALLANNQVLDSRDAGTNGMSDSFGPYTFDNKPPEGARIKWDPSSGSYITERNVFKGKYSTATDDRNIHRRKADNDADFADYLINKDRFGDVVKDSFPLAPDGGQAGKFVEYGSEEFANSPMNKRLKWEYQHNGIGAADLNQDGNINSSDVHTVKAAFVNHYIVQTKTVEMNSSTDSFGKIEVVANKLLRSTGVDGSADHVHIDDDKDKIIDNDEKEKILMAGSSKISKTFTGAFIGGLHTIDSFNGQQIATNNGNVMFTKPVVLGEYEGFERAKMMSRGVAEDYFDEINSLSRTKEKAQELAAKIQSEINAIGMVDTDWHYSQYRDSDNDPSNGVYNDRIMFKMIKDVRYDGGLIKIEYDPNKVNGTALPNGTEIDPNNYTDPIVAFRKTFNLTADEIATLDYSGTMDGSTATNLPIDTPNLTYKDARIKIITSTLNGGIDLIVNGKVVSEETPGTGIYNLKGYLKEGENVIAVQMKFQDPGDHYFTLENVASNNTEVGQWINTKLSTDRTKNGDAKYPKFNNNPDYGYTSSWQSKLMVRKADVNNEQEILELGSYKTATKVKDVNPLLRVLIDAMNNPEYRDIFYLGMLNSNMGKNLQLKATISAPTGGSIEGILDVQYDPKSHKFKLVQTKYDAFGGV